MLVRICGDVGTVRYNRERTAEGGRAGPVKVREIQLDCVDYTGDPMIGRSGHYINGLAGPRYQLMPDDNVEVLDG